VAESGGGGILVQSGTLNVVDSVIRDNRALFSSTVGTPPPGGGIDNNGSGAVTISGSLIEGNSASGNGGGYADAGKGPLTVSDSFFLNNSVGTNGGGISAGGSTIAITDTTIAGNSAAQEGGGVVLSGTGTARLTDSTLLGNSAYEGGGGISDNQITELIVAGCTVSGNHSIGFNGGGLITHNLGDVTISNSLFRDNTAYEAGGALTATGGTLEISSSRFTGNSAQEGGAIQSSATTFSITASTFDANRAAAAGGVIGISVAPSDSITNCTIVANACGGLGAAPGGAAAVIVFGSGTNTLALTDDTIDNNTGGGVGLLSDTISIRGTIIAGNGTDFAYEAGTLTDLGGNLLGSTTGDGGKFSASTIVGDPKLGPLADNGGPSAGGPSTSQVVATQALLPGSPAFAKGLAVTGLTTDERGFGRAVAPSIGAYQPQYAATATANQVFVENAYEVLFNQTADPAGLAACISFLAKGGSPTALVQILQSGTPYLDIEVAQIYRRYLDRAPSAAETSAVAGFLKAGTTVEQLAAALISSAEFANDYGGGQSDVFVEAAFMTTVGRPPATQAELTAWDGALAAGLSRGTAATLLLTSTEYLADLTTDDFESFFGGEPKPSDIAAFAGAAKVGVSSTARQAIALGSSFAART
jgi:hypothetical protein